MLSQGVYLCMCLLVSVFIELLLDWNIFCCTHFCLRENPLPFFIFISNLRYLFIFQTCITILILPLLSTILLVE